MMNTIPYKLNKVIAGFFSIIWADLSPCYNLYDHYTQTVYVCLCSDYALE